MAKLVDMKSCSFSMNRRLLDLDTLEPKLAAGACRTRLNTVTVSSLFTTVRYQIRLRSSAGSFKSGNRVRACLYLRGMRVASVNTVNLVFLECLWKRILGVHTEFVVSMRFESLALRMFATPTS